ncbi:MAG TPA: HNH endonuclease [Dehalococcoidia bacterium]|nr:HNH endonuclease [Dehalococcoidia bacterium]
MVQPKVGTSGEELEFQRFLKLFVDYLLPRLTPYESTVYLFLLRYSWFENGSTQVRVGKRTISRRLGLGVRSSGGDYDTISRNLKSLEEKGCVNVGDTNREGTLYTVQLPEYVPMVAEQIAALSNEVQSEDYFNDPLKRREIFERDRWTCQYCGERVTEKNATLDHFVPQSKGGSPTKDNLRTACLDCNSTKSGKSYEEAAPHLLTSIQSRRARARI